MAEDKKKWPIDYIILAVLLVLFIEVVILGIQTGHFSSHGNFSKKGTTANYSPTPTKDEELPLYLVGKNYAYPLSFEIIDKYGSPETLSGTDPEFLWVVYFPKGNFTFVIKKGENRILRVLKGRVPQ